MKPTHQPKRFANKPYYPTTAQHQFLVAAVAVCLFSGLTAAAIAAVLMAIL